MRNFIFGLLFIFILGGCVKSKGKLCYDGDFMEVYDLAINSNKKLWVLIGGDSSCYPCNKMILDMKNKGVFSKYEDDYIFYKGNMLDSNNVFLHYILLTQQIPNSYIFNETGELVYGAYDNETLYTITNSLEYVKSGFPLYHTGQDIIPLATEKLLGLYNTTLKAYFSFIRDNNTDLTLVDSSINIYPYFYNLYLKSKILKERGELHKSDSIATIALEYYRSGWQAILYRDLYEELTEQLNVDMKDKLFPNISFEKNEIDLGECSIDSSKEVIFNFENNGNAPLILLAVKMDCACGDVKYPTSPINPGEKGAIIINYIPKNRGSFRLTVNVHSNIKEKHNELIFECVVL